MRGRGFQQGARARGEADVLWEEKVGRDQPHGQRPREEAPAWRARQAEILVLAMVGQKKNIKARRFETLRDITLCKVHKPTRVLQGTGSSNATAEPDATQ